MMTTRAQRALDYPWLGLQPLRRVVFAYALCAVLFSTASAGEYVFFAGQEYELRFETRLLGEQPHVVSTAKGVSPNLYGPPGVLYDYRQTRRVTYSLTIETVSVEIVQDLTVQWIAREQVMRWFAEAEATIALDRWTLLDLSIPARKSQFRYVGQGSLFDLERSIRDANLLMGDVDLMGTVDGDDLSILLGFWGTGQRWSTGDLGGDYQVGDDDLSLLLSNWTDVPEPSMFWVLGLVLLRRRRWSE